MDDWTVYRIVGDTLINLNNIGCGNRGTATGMENTEHDPTSHAEINVIKEASKILGKRLSGCILISTHEPCPMCATAVVWAGITDIAYGYSIDKAISQKRKRINLPCREIFD